MAILDVRRRRSGAAVPRLSSHPAPALVALARKPGAAVLSELRSDPSGLTEDEAERRLAEHGPNQIAAERRHGWPRRLLGALRNPLVVLLGALSAVAFATGDARAGSMMLGMVALGVVLRFAQEQRADTAAARLQAMITVTATVVRGGRAREVPLAQLVPGDVVQLSAGDMIPADLRVLSAKDLFVVQASLTGESLPVEKSEAADTRDHASPVELSAICFLGSSVDSGSGTAVVVATGARSYLGGMARTLAAPPPPTAFDQGVRRFTWLMIHLIAVLVPLVFLVNGLTKHQWREAFFFALAVAVGLTPEMLPMIVSVCLSKGALAMSRQRVIVKRLDSIQNLGAMDVLCTDKTGTLTLDRVILEQHCDVVGEEDESVLLDAYLISHFQTGLKNVLDRAILDHDVRTLAAVEEYAKVDEIPFDFSRRLMSVVVRLPGGGRRLVCKGAPEAVYARCDRFELKGEVFPIDPVLVGDLRDEYERLSSDGFRVLAVAFRDVGDQPAYGKADERDMVLKGYVAFLDPPKDSAAPAIAALERDGVRVKVLTGDNELVARKVCAEVGLRGPVVLGSEIESLSDAELEPLADRGSIFARLSPAHKQRVVRALQRRGHVVGFLGDGINDAPGLHGADVGISVDSAVDIAKESADLILLEKSLLVLEAGVLEGRKVFANILKYVRMGASSNFGNMFSVLGGSAFLPFVPMAPIQVLTNNLLYDISQIPIPTDHVDAEQIARPRPWAIDQLRRFIFAFGPLSSIFDYTTFFVMLYVFGCRAGDAYHAALFHTGWFVESLMTQTLIVHVIRTNDVPLLRSRASWPLFATSIAIMVIGLYLPLSPLAPALGFVRLPPLYYPLLAATLGCYVLLTQAVKSWLLRRGVL